MLGGKDWDKNLECEGCGKRSTMCECKANDRKENISLIITVLSIVIITTVGLYVLNYLHK